MERPSRKRTQKNVIEDIEQFVQGYEYGNDYSDENIEKRRAIMENFDYLKDVMGLVMENGNIYKQRGGTYYRIWAKNEEEKIIRHRMREKLLGDSVWRLVDERRERVRNYNWPQKVYVYRNQYGEQKKSVHKKLDLRSDGTEMSDLEIYNKEKKDYEIYSKLRKDFEMHKFLFEDPAGNLEKDMIEYEATRDYNPNEHEYEGYVQDPENNLVKDLDGKEEECDDCEQEIEKEMDTHPNENPSVNQKNEEAKTEKKIFDFYHANAITPYGIVVDGFNYPSQGVKDYETVGEEITVEKIILRIGLRTKRLVMTVQDPTVSLPVVDGGGVNVRLILVLDTQANKSLPTFSDILDSHNTAVPATERWLQFDNDNENFRFKILQEWTRVLNPTRITYQIPKTITPVTIAIGVPNYNINVAANNYVTAGQAIVAGTPTTVAWTAALNTCTYSSSAVTDVVSSYNMTTNLGSEMFQPQYDVYEDYNSVSTEIVWEKPMDVNIRFNGTLTGPRSHLDMLSNNFLLLAAELCDDQIYSVVPIPPNTAPITSRTSMSVFSRIVYNDV